MRNARLNKSQAGLMIARRNINNLRYADDTTPVAESKEEQKNLLMKMKKENEKAGLKLNIQKTKIMASSLITSWNIDGETMETVTGFIFLGSKNSADGGLSHETKRHLLLGRKAMTNLYRILKSRDITLPTKICNSQSYGFSNSHIWMWELNHKEGWVPQNWCFYLWCWRRLLQVPWTARSNQSNSNGNQSWIFIGRTDTEAEAPILWPPDAKSQLWKRPWCWERLKVEEKWTTDDEMVGWHQCLKGRESEQTPEDQSWQFSSDQ